MKTLLVQNKTIKKGIECWNDTLNNIPAITCGGDANFSGNISIGPFYTPSTFSVNATATFLNGLTVSGGIISFPSVP